MLSRHKLDLLKLSQLRAVLCCAVVYNSCVECYFVQLKAVACTPEKELGYVWGLILGLPLNPLWLPVYLHACIAWQVVMVLFRLFS